MIKLIEDELGGKIMIEFVALTPRNMLLLNGWSQ